MGSSFTIWSWYQTANGNSLLPLATGPSARPSEDQRSTYSGQRSRSRLSPHDADTSSDPGWQARHPGQRVLEALVMSARAETRHAEGHCHRPVPGGDVRNCSAEEML